MLETQQSVMAALKSRVWPTAHDLGRDVWEHLGYELFSETRRKRLR